MLISQHLPHHRPTVHWKSINFVSLTSSIGIQVKNLLKLKDYDFINYIRTLVEFERCINGIIIIT